MKLKHSLLKNDPEIICDSFFNKYNDMKTSLLYEALNNMPKPVLHHVHSTCWAPIDLLIKLTYKDYVYFNEKEKSFKVSKTYN